MKKEFKGRHFLEIAREDLAPNVRLRCDVFIYLSLNDRMLKIRDREHFIEEAAIAKYARNGQGKFFILDPGAHEGAYAFPAEPAEILNPLIPAEYLPAWPDSAPSAAPAVASANPGDIVVERAAAREPEHEAGEILKAPERPAGEEGHILSGKSEEIAEPASSFAATPAAVDTTAIAPDAAAVEPEQAFGADQAAELDTLRFDPDAGEEEESSRHGTDQQQDKTSVKISADIENLEESLAQFSPEKKEFVQELKRISAGQEKSRAPDWKMNLGDDAPLLTGLPRDEAAAAKLAHALGRRVAQLRRELEGALSFVPDSQAEMPDLLKRREALREEIAKLGATATLIESLDDPHGDLAGLPRDLAGLTRVELVAKLEESLEAMRGSELLSERDHALMTKKVRKVKAQEFGIFGDGVQRAGEQLKKHWSEAQARGQKMSPEQLSQLREMFQREARAARVGEKIADSLAEKRRELAALLATKPASVEARRAQEERAAQLMREIRDLDELSHSVEAGEEISAEQKSLFAAQEAEEDVFVFKAGGPEEADVARALSQLGALKGSLQRAKENSAGAEKVLRQAIRGEPAPAKEEPKIDLRAVRVERLDRAKEKVLAWQESVKESGMEASPSDVVELRQSVAGEIERSRWIVNIDAKLAEAQRQLGKLLRVEAVGDQEKAEMEEQTLLLQDDIQEMRALRDGLQAGDEIEASRLEGYVAGGDTALPGTQAGDIGQVLDSIDSLKRAAITVGREARAAGEEANAQLATSDFEALKDKAVSATGLDAVKKKLSRHLKEFLKTGRSIDQEAIWQINHDIAKQVQHAQAAASIARAQVRATQELRALQASAPADAAESAELGRKISAKTAEIAELQNIGGALERGESVDEATLKNHGGEVDEKFVFTADRSPPETITRIAGALESLQKDLVSIKREAMDALAETVLKGEARPGEETVTVLGSAEEEREREMQIIRDHQSAAQGADEAFKQYVSGADGKALQAGVCAATLFRSFGYRSQDLEHDLILACYLWDTPGEAVRGGFSERVFAVHQASHGQAPMAEMALRDLGQAVRMAREYTEIPGVITGRISLDAEIFSGYCDKLAESSGREIDRQLLERARQRVRQGMPRAEWDSLIDLTKYVSQKLNRWKQGQAA